MVHECTKPKEVWSCSNNLCAYVSSCVMLTKFVLLWMVDLAITDHIARHRGAHVEFRQISSGTRWIYIGNNFKVGVDGIGTCKSELHRGCTLFLYDVFML